MLKQALLLILIQTWLASAYLAWVQLQKNSVLSLFSNQGVAIIFIILNENVIVI